MTTSQLPPDTNDPEVVSAYDELPLWAAPFGLALLDRVEYARGLALLDVGFGTGFPLLELAKRLGPSCRAFGIDPWAEGHRRAARKARTYGLGNVLLVRGVAERLPFLTGSIDVVVSNNGLNNVQDLHAALAECHRVCRRGAQLVLTLNLPDSMRALYDVFASVLRECGLPESLADLERHIHAKRKPLSEVRRLLGEAGFEVTQEIERTFAMRFLDGTALFAHHFVRLGFLEAWKAVPPASAVATVMERLEQRLNETARAHGELRLEVPFACLDCRA